MSGETCDIAFVVDCCIWSELYGWEFGCGHPEAVPDPSEDVGSESEHESEATIIVDQELDCVYP